MNTSKVIKIDDTKTSAIKNFFLKQFPKKDDGTGHDKDDGGSGRHHSALLDIERLTNQAEQEARLIRDNALREAQRIEKESCAQGFSQGLAEGRNAAEAELATLTESFKTILSQFEKLKEAFYESHRHMILELALQISRKVIHQEVVTNRELILGVLDSALKMSINRERLEVRINPEDMELCMQKRCDIVREIDGIKQIVFEPDESVGKGGAIVQSVFGEIDARLEQQFSKVTEELRNVYYE